MMMMMTKEILGTLARTKVDSEKMMTISGMNRQIYKWMTIHFFMKTSKMMLRIIKTMINWIPTRTKYFRASKETKCHPKGLKMLPN